MFEKIAANMAGQMTEEKLIVKEQEEYYIYAIVTHIEQFITVATIFLISLFIDEFVPTLFFLLFFLALRKRTGGYHFKSFKWCYIGTVATYIAVINLNTIIVNYPHILLIALLVSISIIGLVGTVNHPNIHMNIEELTESKKAARILVLLEGGVIYFLYIMDADLVCISSMSCAVILCAVLLCVAKIVKQEVNGNEGDEQTDIESC